MNIPNEVENYFKSGRRKIVKVKASENYSLLLEFDNGEKKRFCLAEKMSSPAFAFLQDAQKFSTVFLDERGSPAWDIDENIDSRYSWNNRIDLDAHACYIYGESLSSAEI